MNSCYNEKADTHLIIKGRLKSKWRSSSSNISYCLSKIDVERLLASR